MISPDAVTSQLKHWHMQKGSNKNRSALWQMLLRMRVIYWVSRSPEEASRFDSWLFYIKFACSGWIFPECSGLLQQSTNMQIGIRGDSSSHEETSAWVDVVYPPWLAVSGCERWMWGPVGSSPRWARVGAGFWVYFWSDSTQDESR